MTAACVFGLALLAARAASPASEAGEPPALTIPVHPGDIPGLRASPVTLDLRAVLERATRDNLDLRISTFEAEAADGERQGAAARWLPSLTVGALARHTDGTLQGTFGDLGTTIFSTALANAIIRWNLNPAETRFRSLAAGHAASAARAEVATSRLRAQVLAATRYLEVLGSAALTTVAQQTRDDADEFLRLTRTLEEKGLGLGADVQRARAQAARRAADLASAQQMFRVASARLAETLDLDPTTPILPGEAAIEEPALPQVENVEPLLAAALADRPESKSAAEAVAAAQARLAALRWGAYGPEVNVEVQQGVIGTEFPEARERSIYGAEVGWTFRPHQIGELRAARARLWAARMEEERARQAIRAETVTSREAVLLAQERIALSREALAAAERALRISRARFGGGLGNALEVLQGQDALAAARAEAVAVLVDAHRAVLELRRALGNPLETTE